MLKVFLDYQNVFRTLRDREGMAILSLDIGSIIREIVEDSGEEEIPVCRAFSRIHYRLGNMKTELFGFLGIELAWIKKTLDTRSWSNCTRGESRS